MDFELILSVLAEKIKSQQTTILLNTYTIEELEKKVASLEKKVNTYEAQFETLVN